MAWNPKRKGVLKGTELEAYYSDYIMRGGYKQDEIAISSIEVDGKRAVATCTFPKFYTSQTDTSFHLSVQRTVDFLTQIACAHALYLTGIPDKNVEIWMTNFHINLTKPQRDPNAIRFELELYARVVRQPTEKTPGPFTFYTWKFFVGESQDWWGEVTYCLPIA